MNRGTELMLKHVPQMRPSLMLAWMLVPVLVMLLAALFPARAGAQGGLGELNAVAGPSFPAGTPITVEAAEFTDLNTRLREIIEKALVARGYKIQPKAPFILSYDTEMSSRTDPEPRGFRDSGTIEAEKDMEETPPWDDGGGEMGRDEPRMFGPDSDSDAISIPLGSSTGTNQNHYSLSFTLGRDGSPAIWQGAVTAVLPNGDPFEIAETMVPVLADHIGQTVREKQVPIK